jgi:hypothetical protein
VSAIEIVHHCITVDNIKILYLENMGLENMHWINLVQDRVQWEALVNMVMNLWVP